MKNQSCEDKTATPAIGAAFYPGKQDWKGEPGNRYTARDLKEMSAKWDVEIKNTDTPRSCQAD